MNVSALFRFVIAAAFLCLITSAAQAQANATGYTSIDYDENTNTVTAYSKTDFDYSLVGEYSAYVSLTVTDNSGGLAASGSARDYHGNGAASIVLNFAGEPDKTYTAVGSHRAYLELYDYYETYPYRMFYYDNWYLTYFEGQSIYSPYTYEFSSPTYIYYRRTNRVVGLGRTYDWVSTMALPACGDERDTIIKEYKTYKIALKPICSDFTQVRATIPFPFESLNTGDYTWALIRYPLVESDTAAYGLWKWKVEYGGSMTVNSAYRNPSRNSRIGGAAASRHMFGDAVDIKNETRSMNEYNQRSAAAGRANADYIEPWTGPCGNGCVHADWRNHDGPY